MAEETKTTEAQPQASQDGSMRSVLLGSSVVIWILAIFMIVTLNNLKTELIKLNTQVKTLTSLVGDSNLGQFQVMDKDGEKVIYKFQRVVDPGMMEGEGAGPAAETAPPPEK
jgi:hypothetical protein